MRKYARKDKNHDEIVQAFKSAGCSVLSLVGLGNGVPDILVAKAGRTILVEIKASESAKATDLQTEFASTWRGYIIRVHSAAGALSCIKAFLG
jgi:Holliday junction resolvase